MVKGCSWDGFLEDGGSVALHVRKVNKYFFWPNRFGGMLSLLGKGKCLLNSAGHSKLRKITVLIASRTDLSRC